MCQLWLAMPVRRVTAPPLAMVPYPNVPPIQSLESVFVQSINQSCESTCTLGGRGRGGKGEGRGGEGRRGGSGGQGRRGEGEGEGQGRGEGRRGGRGGRRGRGGGRGRRGGRGQGKRGEIKPWMEKWKELVMDKAKMEGNENEAGQGKYTQQMSTQHRAVCVCVWGGGGGGGGA